MGILFAISIASCCALLWASFSIARHVRASGRSGVTSEERGEAPMVWHTDADLEEPMPSGTDMHPSDSDNLQATDSDAAGDGADPAEWNHFSQDAGVLNDSGALNDLAQPQHIASAHGGSEQL